MFGYSLHRRQLEALLSKYEEYIDFQFEMARRGAQSFKEAYQLCIGYRDSLRNICDSAVFRMKLNNISSKAICYMLNVENKEEDTID